MLRSNAAGGGDESASVMAEYMELLAEQARQPDTQEGPGMTAD